MDLKKIRFSHPTKTGGSSVVKALRTKHPKQKHTHNLLLTELQAKKQGIEYAFATVRDPYERVVDMYNYFKNIQKQYTFLEFLVALETKKLKHIHFVPQHYYVVNGGYKVDDLIRMESFESDWDRIIKNTLLINQEMIHINKTEVKKITNLTTKQKGIIYNIYKEDFLILEYKK